MAHASFRPLYTSLKHSGFMRPVQLLHCNFEILTCLTRRTFFRSVLGTFLPLAGPPLYSSLGLGFDFGPTFTYRRWGNSVLGFIAVILIPIPFLLYRSTLFDIGAYLIDTVNGYARHIQ